jgi:hypothetical protein
VESIARGGTRIVSREQPEASRPDAEQKTPLTPPGREALRACEAADPGFAVVELEGQPLRRYAPPLRRLEQGKRRVRRGAFRKCRNGFDEVGAKGSGPAQRHCKLDLDRGDLPRGAEAAELSNARI